MSIKIAINGFGRIGRAVLRSLYESKRSEINLVAINTLPPADKCVYYAKYDSIYGNLGIPLSFDNSNNIMHCAGDDIKIFSQADPKNLDWESVDADVVLECTGRFVALEEASKHLRPKMHKVIISAPAKNVPNTIVYGVNHKTLSTKDSVISAASCTTNCLAPIAKILHDNFVIISANMTTVHSYTNDQCVLDSCHSDLRRSRASALSIIPTSTGAAKSIGLIIPSLAGKIDGSALRVPTPNVSLIDFVFLVEKKTDAAAVNDVLINAAKTSLAGILDVCNEPLVSVDFLKNTASAIVDLTATKTLGNGLFRVAAWYDNEFAFATRMLDLAKFWCSI